MAGGERRSPEGAGLLLVCATPIGNLEDVTLRVLRALAEADVIACEDTRHTRKLLARHEIEPRGRLVSYHEHNERARAGELAGRVRDGAVVAVVSDAGMPGVSDPGEAVVAECLERGLRVEVLPGPSAVTTALVATGLPAARWRFAGFLPRRRGELERELRAGGSETVVAFESPRRLGATLALLAEIDPPRRLAVCRELTKIHEEVVRGTAAELAERFAGAVKGEVVLVIEAAAADQPDLGAARAAVERLVEAGARRRAAASVVASLTGIRTNRLYETDREDSPDD